ncbi:MAG: hypothetical protein JSV65_07160 [Armatimonadota bacterium]|nr:MAG: hypothetical protein JSV65_07160 [Armatimonadota bacterium]
MRISTVCIVVLVMSCSAAVALAAPAQSAGAATSQAEPAPESWAGALSDLGDSAQVNGSHLDVRLYLNIPELFEVLAKLGVIPAEMAEQALAASEAETADSDGEPSYVRVEVHVRLAEIAPLVAALAQARPVPVPEAGEPAAEKAAEGPSTAEDEPSAEQ